MFQDDGRDFTEIIQYLKNLERGSIEHAKQSDKTRVVTAYKMVKALPEVCIY